VNDPRQIGFEKFDAVMRDVMVSHRINVAIGNRRSNVLELSVLPGRETRN
jgi:hypothetical protein